MEKIEKFLVSEEYISEVPFNYLSVKYSVRAEEADDLDVVVGRHIEKTFKNARIQNPNSKKQYFNKPISRYEFK